MLDGENQKNPLLRPGTDGSGADTLTGLLTRALDEVDYGLMLFQRDQVLSYGNHLARVMLGRGDRLFLEQGRLKARASEHQSALQAGFARAGQGIRCLLEIPSASGEEGNTSLALVPLGHPAEWMGQSVPVLMIPCRPALCAPLSLRFFAQARFIACHDTTTLAAHKQQVLKDRLKSQLLPAARPLFDCHKAGLLSAREKVATSFTTQLDIFANTLIAMRSSGIPETAAESVSARQQSDHLSLELARSVCWTLLGT